jgi:hypothetical protein
VRPLQGRIFSYATVGSLRSPTATHVASLQDGKQTTNSRCTLPQELLKVQLAKKGFDVRVADPQASSQGWSEAEPPDDVVHHPGGAVFIAFFKSFGLYP